MHLKTISPHPSISSPATIGFISISGAINLSLPISIYCPSGSLKVFSWIVVSRDSLLSILMSPETKQNFYFISLTISKSDVLLKAYPLMCNSFDRWLVIWRPAMSSLSNLALMILPSKTGRQ